MALQTRESDYDAAFEWLWPQKRCQDDKEWKHILYKKWQRQMQREAMVMEIHAADANQNKDSVEFHHLQDDDHSDEEGATTHVELATRTGKSR